MARKLNNNTERKERAEITKIKKGILSGKVFPELRLTDEEARFKAQGIYITDRTPCNAIVYANALTLVATFQNYIESDVAFTYMKDFEDVKFDALDIVCEIEKRLTPYEKDEDVLRYTSTIFNNFIRLEEKKGKVIGGLESPYADPTKDYRVKMTFNTEEVKEVDNYKETRRGRIIKGKKDIVEKFGWYVLINNKTNEEEIFRLRRADDRFMRTTTTILTNLINAIKVLSPEDDTMLRDDLMEVMVRIQGIIDRMYYQEILTFPFPKELVPFELEGDVKEGVVYKREETDNIIQEVA